MGKNISDADRKIARRMMSKKLLKEGSRTISDADRSMVQDLMLEKLLNEGSRTISDADRARVEESYIERNDGGMAMSGRGKPVRTF